MSNGITEEQRKALYSKTRKDEHDTLIQGEKTGQFTDSNFEGYSFDVHKAILENHILGEDNSIRSRNFVGKQARLHSMNPLSGKFFNPVGFAMNLAEEGLTNNPSIQQLITQLASDVVGGGAIETTDGKTFTRVLDNDYDKMIYKNVKSFKEDANSELGVLGNLGKGLINRAKQSIGGDSPSRSILGQVISYSQDKIKSRGTQSKHLPENFDPDSYTINTATELEGIDEQSLRYLYSEDKVVHDPIEFARLRLMIKNGLYASNMYVKKHPDIISLEGTSGEDSEENKKDKIKNFLRNRVLKLPKYPDAYYQNWRFDFSKNYPSVYKLFFENQGYDKSDSLDNFISFYSDKTSSFNSKLERDDVRNVSKWNESEENRVSNIKSHYNGQREPKKKEYPLYNISGKYTLKQVKDDVGEELDIRSLNRFISNNQNDIGKISDNILSADIVNNIDDEREVDKIKSNKYYLSFEDIRTGNMVFFRPSIDSITNDTQPSYEEENFLGRTEALPSYQRTTKTRSFAFKVYAGTPKEHILNMKKLNFLDSLCYPIVNSDFSIIQNPLIRMNLGKYYKNVGGYISSLTSSINNDESQWEIDNDLFSPKIIDISLSMVIIHDRMPYYEEGETFDSSGGDTDFQQQFGIDYTTFLNTD